MRKSSVVIILVAAAGLGPLPGRRAEARAKPEQAAGTLTVKAFCEAFEGAELWQRLGPCPGPTAADPAVAKLTEAASRARHQCVELINSGITQKRQRFDAAAARRCLSAELALVGDPARSAPLLAAVRAACDGVAAGLVGAGRECESALDCQAPLACIGPKGAPPGTCVARLGAGRACDDEQLGLSRFYAAATVGRAPCEGGLHCSSAGGELRCAEDLASGSVCPGTDSGECGPGRRCALGHCAPQTRTAVGQVCSGALDCAVGLYCETGGCVTAKAAGAACTDDRECKGACRRGRCAALCSSG